MAEYFDGEIPAPKPIFLIGPGDPIHNLEIIAEALKANEIFTISYLLPHLRAQTTLGYILVIKTSGGRIEATDISGSIALDITNANEILDLIEHSAGVRYSEDWYQRLYIKRNDRAN
jgi:hypothetical protein